VTESPDDRYSTGDGSHFLPLAQVTEHLAERGVQVDFREELPEFLTGYDLILLAGGSRAALPAAKMQQLQERIALGGHVVLAADAFFYGASQTVTELMTPQAKASRSCVRASQQADSAQITSAGPGV